MTSPFEYSKAILQTKEELIVDEQTEAEYIPFLVNRALSYHFDTILFANEMNIRPWLDKKMQFSFLINTTRRQKRSFSKWAKTEKSEDLECVKKVYGYSDQKALEVLKLLSAKQLEYLKQTLDVGGTQRR